MNERKQSDVNIRSQQKALPFATGEIVRSIDEGTEEALETKTRDVVVFSPTLRGRK